MSTSFEPRRTILSRLYGVEFPNSLFHFRDFIDGLEHERARAFLGAAHLSFTGPLELLSRPAETLERLEPKLPLLLHWRFYRDPPEFFTCLHGDTDGEHWGLLLDDPSRGFRGAAAYYNNDGDLIRQYGGLFDAVIRRIEYFLESTEEMIEDDPDYEDDYRAQDAKLKEFRKEIRRYMTANKVPRDEKRGRGRRSDTGLELIIPDGLRASDGSDVGAQAFAKKSPSAAAKWVRKLVSQCLEGAPSDALYLGRSLYYWGGSDYSAVACELLEAAYTTLERPELIRVLRAHVEHRNIPKVDLV